MSGKIQTISLLIIMSLNFTFAINKCLIDDDCIENELNYYCCDNQCCNMIDYIFKDK